MFNSIVLDVAIGLIFAYLILGLMCTTVNEWIAGMMHLRAKNLEKGIHQLLTAQFVDRFYDHPLIKGLIPISGAIPKWRRFLAKCLPFLRARLTSVATLKKTHPAYVPARTFALSIMDIVIKDQQGPTSFNQFLAGINTLPDGDVKQSLLALMQNTDHTLNTAQQRIEGWFNDAMDRVSGLYKIKTQLITVLVAAVITIFANADTIHMANKLFMTPAVRDAFVAAAKNTSSANTSAPQQLTAVDQQLLTALSGWTDDFRKFDQIYGKSCAAAPAPGTECDAAKQNADPSNATPNFPGFRFFSSTLWPWLAWLIPQHIVGWILSAIAVSLGAPFWFDTLNRFMNIRNAGKSPDEGPKGAEKNVA